jgi:transmembrane sensor
MTVQTPHPDHDCSHDGDRIEREALEWFVRQGGGLDVAQRRAFAAWRDADPAHRAALARWQEDWRALDALPAAQVARLRSQVARGRTTARPRRGALAALASVCLVAVGGVLAWSHWQRQPVFEQRFATARGQQSEVRLPDGSRLRLDTATRIDVALYRARREVRLPEGQAVFHVQGDATHPFDVLAGPLRITVVGTRFAVRHTPGVPGAGGVRVAVEQGHVRVARAAADGPVVELTAGQQVASDAAGRLGPVAAVPPSGIAPWRGHRVSFDDTPLDQALAELGRYGPTHLAVRDPAVAALRLTGTFDPRNPGGFARMLPRVLPVRLRERGGTTEIAAAQ